MRFGFVVCSMFYLYLCTRWYLASMICLLEEVTLRFVRFRFCLFGFRLILFVRFVRRTSTAKIIGMLGICYQVLDLFDVLRNSDISGNWISKIGSQKSKSKFIWKADMMYEYVHFHEKWTASWVRGLVAQDAACSTTNSAQHITTHTHSMAHTRQLTACRTQRARHSNQRSCGPGWSLVVVVIVVMIILCGEEEKLIDVLLYYYNTCTWYA